MIGDNLRQIRKQHNYSMEYVAEKINVSRQTIAKWENGESLPDLLKSKELADFYDVSIDSLTQTENDKTEKEKDGKYIFGIVKVGERGQIVLPHKARKIFHIETGDHLLVLGDIERGLAIIKADVINELME